jgi:hypothetical protein
MFLSTGASARSGYANCTFWNVMGPSKGGHMMPEDSSVLVERPSSSLKSRVACTDLAIF